jgi:hypothetical protein
MWKVPSFAFFPSCVDTFMTEVQSVHVRPTLAGGTGEEEAAGVLEVLLSCDIKEVFPLLLSPNYKFGE